MVCAYFHPISGAQPGIRRHSVKRHSALMLEGCKQVMRMNPDGDASCDGYAMIELQWELCSVGFSRFFFSIGQVPHGLRSGWISQA